MLRLPAQCSDVSPAHPETLMLASPSAQALNIIFLPTLTSKVSYSVSLFKYHLPTENSQIYTSTGLTYIWYACSEYFKDVLFL